MMVNWFNFFVILFWISILGFLINLENFLRILIFSEITWIILYCYTVVSSISNNDLNLLSNSFFIIAFASVEFSIGLLLIIVFKNNMKSINLDDLDDFLINKDNTVSKKKNYINISFGKKVKFSYKNCIKNSIKTDYDTNLININNTEHNQLDNKNRIFEVSNFFENVIDDLLLRLALIKMIEDLIEFIKEKRG